jgi:uncharacterized MAPEG superfamily protein
MSSSLGNFSIVSIPAYYVLSFLPHAYGIHVASGGNPAAWDNRCPRASKLKSSLQANLPADVYAKYERAEAASANSYENMPLYIGAIILGHFAKLDKAVLDKFAFRFLLVRAVYALVYVQTARQSRTPLRTLLWGYSIWMCVQVYLQAAKALAA